MSVETRRSKRLKEKQEADLAISKEGEELKDDQTKQEMESKKPAKRMKKSKKVEPLKMEELKEKDINVQKDHTNTEIESKKPAKRIKNSKNAGSLKDDENNIENLEKVKGEELERNSKDCIDKLKQEDKQDFKEEVERIDKKSNELVGSKKSQNGKKKSKKAQSINSVLLSLETNHQETTIISHSEVFKEEFNQNVEEILFDPEKMVNEKCVVNGETSINVTTSKFETELEKIETAEISLSFQPENEPKFQNEENFDSEQFIIKLQTQIRMFLQIQKYKKLKYEKEKIFINQSNESNEDKEPKFVFKEQFELEQTKEKNANETVDQNDSNSNDELFFIKLQAQARKFLHIQKYKDLKENKKEIILLKPHIEPEKLEETNVKESSKQKNLNKFYEHLLIKLQAEARKFLQIQNYKNMKLEKERILLNQSDNSEKEKETPLLELQAGHEKQKKSNVNEPFDHKNSNNYDEKFIVKLQAQIKKLLQIQKYEKLKILKENNTSNQQAETKSGIEENLVCLNEKLESEKIIEPANQESSNTFNDQLLIKLQAHIRKILQLSKYKKLKLEKGKDKEHPPEVEKFKDIITEPETSSDRTGLEEIRNYDETFLILLQTQIRMFLQIQKYKKLLSKPSHIPKPKQAFARPRQESQTLNALKKSASFPFLPATVEKKQMMLNAIREKKKLLAEKLAKPKSGNQPKNKLLETKLEKVQETTSASSINQKEETKSDEKLDSSQSNSIEDAENLILSNIQHLSPRELDQLTMLHTRLNGGYKRKIDIIEIFKEGTRPVSPNAQTLSKLKNNLSPGNLKENESPSIQDDSSKVKWKKGSELAVSSLKSISSPSKTKNLKPSKNCLKKLLLQSKPALLNSPSPVKIQKFIYESDFEVQQPLSTPKNSSNAKRLKK